MEPCNYPGDENEYCTRPQNHKGKHKYAVEWETRPRDIPHDHEWAPVTYGTDISDFLTLGGDPGPTAQCSFCGKLYYLNPPEEFVRMQRAMVDAVLGHLAAPLRMAPMGDTVIPDVKWIEDKLNP